MVAFHCKIFHIYQLVNKECGIFFCIKNEVCKMALKTYVACVLIIITLRRARGAG